VMKKSKTYFCIATLLVVAGLIFLAFALTHPEASFKVDIGLLYLFYAMYILLIIFLYLVGIIKKCHDRKNIFHNKK